jgi:hypothetical protein
MEMALGVETENSVGPVGTIGPKGIMGLGDDGFVGVPAAGEVGLAGEGNVIPGVVGAGALGLPPPTAGYTTGLETEPAVGDILVGTIAALAR